MSRVRRQRAIEWVIERLIQAAGVLAIIFVLLIFAFLLRGALPILQTVSAHALLGGQQWRPTSDPAQFGLLPLLIGSAYVTFGALVIAVPLGVACAVCVAEVAPSRLREILKPLVELIAAVPSVVFGFVGLIFLGPWLAERLDLPLGQFAALGSVLLAFMAIPTIVSVSEDALRSVPRALRDGSRALGATEWQTICRVVLPAARSGVVAAVLLGLGRAIGETMTVLMVTGNAAVIPEGLSGFLRPVRTLTATIALEMGETPQGSTHYHALFAIGLVLFAATLAVNGAADIIVRRARRAGQ